MQRLLLALGLLAIACSSTDPTSPAMIPIAANLSGSWTMRIDNIAGSGITCSTDEFNMTLAQTGTTFSGGYGQVTLTCSANNQSVSDVAGPGTIANGALTGAQVSFDLDTPDAHHSGTVSGTLMSGTARYTLSNAVLTGTWHATKQAASARVATRVNANGPARGGSAERVGSAAGQLARLRLALLAR